MLTAVTIVLALLAIVIAILAVWGYQSIKNEASQLAQRAVEVSVTEAVKKHLSEPSIRAKMDRELRRMMEGFYPFAFGSPVQGEQGKVAEDYPEGQERPDNAR